MKKFDIDKLYKLKDEGYLHLEKHEKYDLLLWKYTSHCQYEQHWTEETLACRSLVTNSEGTVISSCIPKFFNLEENKHTCTNIYEISQKLDGQLVYIFYYNSIPIVRSSGSFTSDVVENVWKYLSTCSLSVYKEFCEDYTYCFEFTGTVAKIVVEYPYKAGLTHITTFNENHEEINVCCHFEQIKKYQFAHYKNLANLNIENEEGFVIKFSNGQRCKIKFQNYIEKHFFRFALSTTLIWRHLRDDTIHDYLKDLPDESYHIANTYTLKLVFEKEAILKMIGYNIFILRNLHFENRKEFHDFVHEKLRFPHWTMSVWDRGIVDREVYKSLQPEYKLLT